MKVAIALHILSAVVWVGGMFFSYMALRPVAATLNPEVRLPLWSDVFDRFFRFVWIAIVLLLATGYWMIIAVFGGFKGLALYLNLMQTIGLVMMMLFMHVYFAPYRKLKRAVAAGDLDQAGKNLCQIRKLIAVNLTLGLLTIIIGSTGRYW